MRNTPCDCYVVERLNLDMEVVGTSRTPLKELAMEWAESLFMSGYPSRVLDPDGHVIVEFEQ